LGNNAVRLSQDKTGEPLSLYLLPGVGWAIIDYIKHGRPISGAPEIFVRQVPPHIKMKELSNIILKYLRLAKVPIERVRHHGMHTLWHSLATTLLEQGCSIDDIQAMRACGPKHDQSLYFIGYQAVDVLCAGDAL
jgi:integrase